MLKHIAFKGKFTQLALTAQNMVAVISAAVKEGISIPPSMRCIMDENTLSSARISIVCIIAVIRFSHKCPFSCSFKHS